MISCLAHRMTALTVITSTFSLPFAYAQNKKKTDSRDGVTPYRYRRGNRPIHYGDDGVNERTAMPLGTHTGTILHQPLCFTLCISSDCTMWVV